MRPAPPRWLEVLVGILIPPACREVVLGDLYERYSTTGRYLLDAISTVPLVILSRIRRTTDPSVLLMEAMTLYLSFVTAARYHDTRFLLGPWGLLRPAIPAAIALLAIVLEDAYAHPRKRAPLRPIVAPLFGIAMALLAQRMLRGQQPELALPTDTLWLGGAVGLLLVSSIRLLFPPLSDRFEGAGGPAFWMQRTAEPIRVSAGVVRLVKGVGLVSVLAAVAASTGYLKPGVLVVGALLVLVYEMSKRA